MDASLLLQIDPAALRLLSAGLARHFRALPLGFDGKRLTIAVADTANLNEIEAVVNQEIAPVRFPASQILEAIELHYRVEGPMAVSNALPIQPALDASDVEMRFAEARRLRAARQREPYFAPSEEGSEPEVDLADAILRQGARSQTRIFLANGCVFEELDGRFHKTSEYLVDLHEAVVHRFLAIAGFDSRSDNSLHHVQFLFQAEIDSEMWPFEADLLAITEPRGSSALLTFHHVR